MSVCGIRLNMTSCAGVNATICISSVRESTSKRSAFDFTHCNRLCRWRHLLMLSEVILKAHAAHRHSRNLSFLYIIYHKYHFLPSEICSRICAWESSPAKAMTGSTSATISPVCLGESVSYTGTLTAPMEAQAKSTTPHS